MPALSEMPVAEVQLHGHDPDRQRYGEATRWIRDLEVQRAYLLKAKIDAANSREERDTILLDWAEDSGRSVGVLKSELKWTNAIAEDDLRGAFRKAKIPEYEWERRLGTSHLGVIARCFDQNTGELLTSFERAELAVDCYQANLSVEELGDTLRTRSLLPPKRPSKLAPPSKTPNTATTLLRTLADSLEAQGMDIDLSGMLAKRAKDKPIDAAAFLGFLAGEYRREHPGAAFRISEEEGKPQ